MSESRLFVDTNILAYAYDVTSGKKHEVAKELLNKLWENKLGVISVQVLQELSTTLLKKIPKPLSVDTVIEISTDLLVWKTISNDGALLLEALSILKRSKISIWDALIVAAAKRGECSTIYSEDLNHGGKIAGVQIMNPFV